MALPLPQIVSNVGPGGRFVDSMQSTNALVGSMLENQGKAISNQYAPYTNYANALSKTAYANYAPYQLQAQALSNPMLWATMKDHTEALQNMMNSFAGSVPSLNNLPGISQIPLPGQGHGLLNMLTDIFKGKSPKEAAQSPQEFNSGQIAPLGQNNMPVLPGGTGISNYSPENTQNALLNGPHKTSPLVPGAQGGISGLIGQKTAPFVTSPYKSGSLIADPNNPGSIISVPTSKTDTALQNQLSASKRVIPQLSSLGDLFKPFMTGVGKAKQELARLGNLSGATNSDLPSDYAHAKLTAFTTVESYLKSIGVPVTVDVQADLKKMIEPIPGENSRGYNKRIQEETNNLIQEFANPAQEQLSSGYSTIPAPPPNPQSAEPTQEDIEHTAKVNNVTIAEVRRQLGLK